jgi:hypothetical protein
MNLYTYYDNGTWKAFEAESLPVKPERCPSYHYLCTDVINDGCRCDRFQSEYDYLISTLKSKALPVGNPEIFKVSEGGVIRMGTMLYHEEDDKFYLWPGEAEKKVIFGDLWQDANNKLKEREVYHLTLSTNIEINLDIL